MMLVCREPENWYEVEWTMELNKLKQDQEILSPRMGTHIISRPEVPAEITKTIEQTSKADENHIFIHNISLDKQKMLSLIDMFSSPS